MDEYGVDQAELKLLPLNEDDIEDTGRADDEITELEALLGDTDDE